MLKHLFWSFIVCGILASLIASSLSEKNVGILNWQILVPIFALVAILSPCIQVVRRRRKFRALWDICKPSKKLRPEDFKIQSYKNAYVYRESDSTVRVLLKDRDYILISGKPKAGKTRLAYETISKLGNFMVIAPEAKIIEARGIKLPMLGNRNFVLLFDDLQRFIDTNIDNMIESFRRRSGKLVVIATCRTGQELDSVKEELLSLHREFMSVELMDITEEDGMRLASDAGIKWRPGRFDGTPGSVVLDLEDMKERYRKAGDGRAILKALKLLRAGNIHIYTESCVKGVCKDIFQFSDEKLRRYSWDEEIGNLRQAGFLTTQGEVIYIYSSYLDTCVYDYDPDLNENDIIGLKRLFARVGDSRNLFFLGNGFRYRGDFRFSADCYREALGIEPLYAPVHRGLGLSLEGLAKSEMLVGHYDLAEELYREAEEELREAIRLQPDYTHAYNNLGYILSEQGKHEEAAAEFREAIRLQPDYAEAHNSLGYILAEQGKYEEAAAECREAMRLKPDYAEAHNSLGYILAEQGKYEEAAAECREAMRLKPDYAEAYSNLGYLLAGQGKCEEAAAACRESIRLKPDYAEAYNTLGYALTGQGKYEEAATACRESIRLKPDYAVAYNTLGYALTGQGKYEEAATACRESIRLKPDYAVAYNSLGYALAGQGKYEEAAAACRESIRLQPDYAEAYNNLGYVLAGQGKYEEAEKKLREFLNIDPHREDILIRLGVILERSGRYEEAEDCYKNVLKRNPGSIRALNVYGYFLLYRGKAQEAKEQFHKVLQVNPNSSYASAGARASRGRALTRLGRFDQAEKEIGEALRLDPENATAHKNLGILREAIGDISQSQEDRLSLYKQSEAEYRKSLDTNPMNASAHRHLANLLAKLDRYEEAESEYKRTKKVASRYPKNNRDFGIFLSRVGRFGDAKKELNIALKLFRARGAKEEVEEVEEFLKGL